MADKNLVQQIDRISYAVAGVVGLAVLILPILSGGNLAETRDILNDEAGKLRKKKQEQVFDPLPVRGLEDEIKSQWRPGSGGENRLWITDAVPCLVKRAKSIKRRPAVHNPGVITEISAHRDNEKKQVYLVVKGAMGAENDHVVIEEVRLSRREGDGNFTLIGKFKGDFEYRDVRVKPGEKYAYMFTTVASRDSAAPSNILAPEDSEQESVELETPGIPYDFSVKIRQFFRGERLGELPRVMADFDYWDYAKGETVEKKRGTFEEKTVLGKRYMISRIDSAKRTITVKDSRWSARYPITSKDEPFTVDLWEPVAAEVEEEASEEDEEYEEIGAAAEPEPVKAPATAPAPRRTRSKRGF